jgi:hypothetical protein
MLSSAIRTAVYPVHLSFTANKTLPEHGSTPTIDRPARSTDLVKADELVGGMTA